MKLIQALFLISAPLIAHPCAAQDSSYTQRILGDLTSTGMYGRGYVKNGSNKAGAYLAKEFQSIGLTPIPGRDYRQYFDLPINQFPHNTVLEVDGQKLIPGIDYLVAPGSPPVSGTFEIVTLRPPTDNWGRNSFAGKWICLDTIGTGFNPTREELRQLKTQLSGVAGILYPEPKKLTWSVSQNQNTVPELTVLAGKIKGTPHKIRVRVRSRHEQSYRVFNVVGSIPGTADSDTSLYITAHYDHLGCMGPSTCFPGANDNASGVSMLLHLARHFSEPKNRLRHRLVFIAFAAEEAGLVGSKHYTENPWTPLDKIKFLLNLDLLGTGEDGMMVVNATEHPDQFRTLDSLNKVSGGLKEIRQRGKAANSDHYWFSEKGVPSFFCYTLGGNPAYHDINDKPEGLSLAKYREVFNLLIGFLNTF